VKSGGPSDRDIVGISSDYYKLRGIQFCYTIELPPSNKEAGSLSDKFQPHRSKIKQVVEENFVGILSLYEIARPNVKITILLKFLKSQLYFYANFLLFGEVAKICDFGVVTERSGRKSYTNLGYARRGSKYRNAGALCKFFRLNYFNFYFSCRNARICGTMATWWSWLFFHLYFVFVLRLENYLVFEISPDRRKTA